MTAKDLKVGDKFTTTNKHNYTIEHYVTRKTESSIWLQNTKEYQKNSCGRNSYNTINGLIKDLYCEVNGNNVKYG